MVGHLSCKKGRLESYWVKTSANFLVKRALKSADRNFGNTFDKLAAGGEEWVYATLDTSFAERDSLYSLWGLLVNAGYLTVVKWIDADSYIVKIPNHEVLSELQLLITELSGVDRLDLQQMFQYLMNKDMNGFGLTLFPSPRIQTQRHSSDVSFYARLYDIQAPHTGRQREEKHPSPHSHASAQSAAPVP